MILADIGNRHAHLWNDGTVTHLDVTDAITQYGAEKVCYINVSEANSAILAAQKRWTDISDTVSIKGEYEGMGVDRKALCLSREEGIFVDAGSAITVDRVTSGVYQGGFILPGIHAYAKAYAGISPVLDLGIDRALSLKLPARSTRESISYGTILSIVAAIEKYRGDLPLYCTGGDGAWLSQYLEKAVFDETLLFQGMSKMIEKAEIC